MFAPKFIAIYTLAMLGVAGIANAQMAMSAPDPIATGTEKVLALSTSARGAQVYLCAAQLDNPAKFGWTLVTPHAELLDSTGRAIGAHYAGPSWELGDGSRVSGVVQGRKDSPMPKAIPWLLIKVTTNANRGVLRDATLIQRVDTVGGLPPESGCDAAHGGNLSSVPYSATYRFYN